MNKRAVSLLVGLMSFPLIGLAEEKPAAEKKAEATGPKMKQMTCPVSGKPVSEDAFTMYKDHKVFFCCDKCKAKFEAKPDPFLPALYKQIYPQHVQTKCPVGGEPIDPTVSTETKHGPVYFCCDKCIPKYDAEPDKYKEALHKAMTRQVHCPVTGKAINPAVTMEYKGKAAYFHDKQAMETFKADPEKYAEKLMPEAGVVVRGATADDDLVLCATCVAGGKADPYQRGKTVTAVHDGKVYYFCCKDCAKKFDEDPAKHIQALDQEMAKLKPAKAEGHGEKAEHGEHEGHDEKAEHNK